MRLSRLRFEGFGCFNRGLDIRFEDGINIVMGPNESGKSTVVEGMMAILFGFPDRATEDSYRPRGVYGAWTGELGLVTSDGEYHIARDFETHRILVTRTSAKGTVTLFQGEVRSRAAGDGMEAYLDLVENILGFRDGAVARQTLFMPQSDLATSLDERIRRLLSGTRVGDYGQILRRIEERLARLSRESTGEHRPGKPGRVEVLEEEIRGSAHRLERAREALSLGGRLVDEISELTAELAHSRTVEQEKSRLLENYSEFFDVNSERGDLERRLRILREEKEKVKGLEADCQRVDAVIQARYNRFAGQGPELGEALRNLGNFQREVAEMSELLGQREKELTGTPWPRLQRLGLMTGATAFALTFGAFWIGGNPVFGLAAGLSLGLASFAGIHLLGRGKEQSRIRLETQVVELSERLERRRSEMFKLDAILHPLIGERRIKEVIEEFRSYREQADLFTRYAQVRDSHRPLDEVEADYDNVFQRLKLADSRARDLIAQAPYLAGADENLDMVSVSLEKARRERDEVAATVAGVAERLEALKLRQARLEGGQIENLEELEGDLSGRRQLLTEAVEERDALSLALTVLRECVSEFQEGHLDRLARRVGRLMQQVTAGRYERVTLDRDFVPTVITREGEEYRPDQLSQATRDQLYLVLRMGLSEEITGDGTGPLLMDDAFSHFDDGRLEALRGLLTDLAAEGRQVILFTHQPVFRKWGRVAVNLGSGRFMAAA